MEAFDLLADLPSGTTLLEASAGTGKTYAVGALVTRYVAEGLATLEQMLIITFGRAASQELRERVHEQLVEAERGLADPAAARRTGGVVGLLAGRTADGADDPTVDDAVIAERRERLRSALASFDAATIATTHQFCQLVLRSLGVAGDTDTSARLVEDLDELVVEVTDDAYLARFGGVESPPISRADALALARAVIEDPQAGLHPRGASGNPGLRAEFAEEVRAEVERRKRRLGVLSYDDLLSRLATALEGEDSPARERMRHRWRFVLVDEFQDTDPVQWKVLDRAFTGHATMVLIGDPKQAIYGFRGGDIATYLDASAGVQRFTLDTNYRSDAPLVAALDSLLGGTALGDPRIVVHPVRAHHEQGRLLGAPVAAPVRVRVLGSPDPEAGPRAGSAQLRIADAREHIAADLADDVARLLGSGALLDGRAVRAGDVAVLMQSLRQVELFRGALAAHGIASVVNGGSSVLTSPAAADWLTLLEALEQPHRTQRVRAVALTPFLGYDLAELDAGGDDLTDELAERVRGWLDLVRFRGIAAVHEALVADGLAARVLGYADGERRLTDLTHLAQLLHEVSRSQRLGIPALLGWLRTERRTAARIDARARRLDTDADAVQFTTIHGSKGLQYPIVYLPTAFNRWVRPELTAQLFHAGGDRMLDVGGSLNPAAVAEAAAEELRLTYVALTRAQSQVVLWWAPTRDAATSGVSRLLLGRAPGEPVVPDAITMPGSDSEVRTRFGAWASVGAFACEPSELVPAGPVPAQVPATEFEPRYFRRPLDTHWRRTSYSGLIRLAEEGPAPTSEPEVEGLQDETQEAVLHRGAAEVDRQLDLPSPMAEMPAGAEFGSLIHGVLEHADPQAPDLLAELRARIAEQRRWWPVKAETEEVATALLPTYLTPLGPLADGLTLAEIAQRDRLCELDFEFPLAGGDLPDPARIPLAEVADVLRRHLAADDPLRPYAEIVAAPGLGDQVLRGYLSGSIDVVLRVPDAAAGSRYLVVDYKTNRLGETGKPLTALDYTPAAMTAAMLHSHYPLQALLYSVVLHRYLRWRLPGYRPEAHLGGVLYLYLRGMCGPQTPTVEGQPCGVFAWHPPAAMVVELSALLDARRPEEDR